MVKVPNKQQRALMRDHRRSPYLNPKSEVMKKLKIENDYHKFNSLFYKCTMLDEEENNSED